MTDEYTPACTIVGILPPNLSAKRLENVRVASFWSQ